MATGLIIAAGILYICDGKVLLLRRSSNGDAPGYWGIPGGKTEGDEGTIEAAIRESEEEIGRPPYSRMFPIDRTNDGRVEYTTFSASSESQFTPTLNDEHDEWGWFRIGNYPEPLHPGVRHTLDRMSLTELEVAEGIRDGKYPSPSPFHNIWLFAMRVTGTGYAYRLGKDEFVYRDPKDYLTDEFLRRCMGRPIIAEHPERSSLNSKEFKDRTVGTIILPYIKGEEVWAIATIYSAPAVEMLVAKQWSTSPTVVFTNPAINTTHDLGDGFRVLKEEIPSLLDHVAICDAGVWDKGRPPDGVELTYGVQDMAEEAVEKAEKKADASPAEGKGGDDERWSRFDKMCDMLSGVHDTVRSLKDSYDASCARMDSLESAFKEVKANPAGAADSSKRADGEDAEEANSATEKGPEEKSGKVGDKKSDSETVGGKPAIADKKSDAEGKPEDLEKKEMADKARADAENQVAARLDALESRLPEEIKGDASEEEMADAQAKADSLYMGFNKKAPAPLRGEKILAYRRRLVSSFQQHSKNWKDVNLAALPKEAFDVAEGQIMADAQSFLSHPLNAPEGTLRESITTDDTGRRIRTFHGSPSVWLNDFKYAKRSVSGINKSFGA